MINIQRESRDIVGYKLFGKFFKEDGVSFIIKLNNFGGARIHVKCNRSNDYIGVVDKHEIKKVYSDSPDMIKYNYEKTIINENEIERLKSELNRRLLNYNYEIESRLNRDIIREMQDNSFTAVEIIFGIVAIISLIGGMISFINFTLRLF